MCGWGESMEASDFTTRREAILTQTTHDGDTVRGHYRWNTGEISQISVPPNFFFDPSNAIRPSSYAQSSVATADTKD